MSNTNILTSYSFLASLNETGTDMYNAVYVPMCKRAVSLYASKCKQNHGTAPDIKLIINDEYGIDVPILVTKKLIVAVANSLSKREKERSGFEVFEGGASFKFDSYTFNQLEDSYEQARRNAGALQYAFEEFLKNQGINDSTIVPFAEFIYKYQHKLSAFLAGKDLKIEDAENTYINHVKFIQFIESYNDTIYRIVKHIFIGSIIASYIESNMDIHAKMASGISYYLDTKIVLEALDLQQAEDTQPINELLQLIRACGGNIRILDITIQEIHGIIETAISKFNKQTPTTTINEACLRTGRNKTWLTSFNGQLEKYLIETLKINIDKVSETEIERYTNTEDTKELQNIWYRKNAAAHDVISYLYIREKRRISTGNNILPQKATYWFITPNSRLCQFNASKKINGYPSETILPQNLASLLFLQNPQRNSAKISTIGLNELIAQVIFDEYPSRDIINEFDTAVQECADISEEDYAILLTAVSEQSTSKLENLMEIKKVDPERFMSNVHSIIAAEKSQREKQKTHYKEERLRSQEELRKMQQNLAEAIARFEETEGRISALETDNMSIKKDNITLKDENDHLKLSNWKRPRYVACICILILCVFIFVMYYAWGSWEYNYPYKLIKYINSLEEVEKDMAKAVLFVTHGGLFSTTIYAILCLALIQKTSDKRQWFIKVIRVMLKKE